MKVVRIFFSLVCLTPFPCTRRGVPAKKRQCSSEAPPFFKDASKRGQRGACTLCRAGADKGNPCGFPTGGDRGEGMSIHLSFRKSGRLHTNGCCGKRWGLAVLYSLTAPYRTPFPMCGGVKEKEYATLKRLLL